jgi:hypothetical protein
MLITSNYLNNSGSNVTNSQTVHLIVHLDQIETLEGQAQFVEDFTRTFLELNTHELGRISHGKFKTIICYSSSVIKMAVS